MLQSSPSTKEPHFLHPHNSLIKDARYLITHPLSKSQGVPSRAIDDDASEAVLRTDDRNQDSQRRKKKGQNKAREFGTSRDGRGLCSSRATFPEFSPRECKFGDGCKFEHDLRKYLKDWKNEDLTTFGGKCPVWSLRGKCDVGWKCRFVGSHMTEREAADGRPELILIEDASISNPISEQDQQESGIAVVNVVSTEAKFDLARKVTKTPKTDAYSKWLDESSQPKQDPPKQEEDRSTNEVYDDQDSTDITMAGVQDRRASYKEPPFLPSEKRRVYFGPETPVLAPLTTQGNLPFRRICVDFGAQLTYSEMAMSMPLIQGSKSEWALMKAHETEILPPRYNGAPPVVQSYDNPRDLKFGAQIAGNKPWVTMKATEILTKLCPHLRVIDLNCGCPIDLVYRQGAGSGLLDSQSKLEKMLRGMNAVSEEIPITMKIRMGTKDGKPTALKLIDRVVYGVHEGQVEASESCGVAAVTLHGRSRQQRYSRSADWEYISTCAALINRHRKLGDDLADTVREADPRFQSASDKVYFVGNGDCYSHTDYSDHLAKANVDSVMVARGALVKPWIFEEIEKGQYLDKSASERLSLVEKYARYGLETWGSDEMGVGLTRRFLLEWLSFAYRYIPVGLLEYLPPGLQDRPPAWRGRNDLETLLGSDNYKDWIKIR